MEYEEEHLPPPRQQVYQTPPQMGEGLLQYQLDMNEIIDEIEHVLKNEKLILDPKTNTTSWERPEGMMPLINQKGISHLMVCLKSRLTKIFILSDLENETIEGMTINIGQNIIDMIYDNWDLFEIRDPATASLILGMITDTVFATLRKGYLGNYLKFLKTVERHSEVQQYNASAIQRQTQQANPAAKIPIIGRLFK